MAQIDLAESARADVPEWDKERDDKTHEIAPDVAYQRLGIVNVIYIGHRNGEWVLVDAGLPGTGATIQRAVTARFGKNSKPRAIVMTHAHADHAGALEALAQDWQVPIYAHDFEQPFLNGTSAYPPPDPGVGGGLMPAMSVLFPRGPFNVARWLQPLPDDFSIPVLPGWKWIFTPGHTPGHISLWRHSDRLLVAGDAFVTTVQESVYAVAVQKAEMHGPPMYYTQNWNDAEASVKTLAALEPEFVVTGHGRAMRGEPMRTALHSLAQRFREVAIPKDGKYVKHPVDVPSGSAYAPR